MAKSDRYTFNPKIGGFSRRRFLWLLWAAIVLILAQFASVVITFMSKRRKQK